MTSKKHFDPADARDRQSSRRSFLRGALGTVVAGSILTKLTGCATTKAAPKQAAVPVPPPPAAVILGSEESVPAGAAMPFRIGTAEADITPTWPVPMAGFSFRKGKPSEGKYQDLFVRAMSISDGKNRVIYLMGDICYWDRKGGGRRPRRPVGAAAPEGRPAMQRGFSSPIGIIKSIQGQLKESNGIDPNQVIFVATHTHSGPVVNEEKFRPILIAQSVKAVQQAIVNEQDARLFFGRGRTNVGVSRRGRAVMGESVWQINPYGQHDKEVVVIKAVGRDGKPIGLLFNYNCHPTTMGTQMIGGDYAGFAQLELKQRLAIPTALFLQGCAGDAKTNNPIPDRPFNFLSPTKATVDQPAKFGKQLADDVCKVLSGKMDEITGPIALATREIKLPVLSAWTGDGQKFSDSAANVNPKDPFSGPRRRAARMAKRMLDSMDKKGNYKVTQPADIYSVRIGDDFIHVGLSGEVCAPIGLRIKDEMRGKKVLVTAYTGPMHGYVPGQAQITAGGYEVFTNPNRKPYSPEVEDVICCEAADLVQSIGPAIPSLEPPPAPKADA
ncbi:hypothetical protein LLG95_08645 [bacterium]|nr:hypothetical protein [bacterium]